MRLTSRSNKTLTEPPAVQLTDLAFNLVIFFVCCASMDPGSGRQQTIPSSSKDKSAPTQASKNPEVSVTRNLVSLNGVPTAEDALKAQLMKELAGKDRPEERMVILKSSKDTPYQNWIRVAARIEEAGGLIALQLEESREVKAP